MAGRARGSRGGRAASLTPDTGISGSFNDTEYKESGGGYDGPDPATGLYPAKLTSVGRHENGSDETSMVWTFDITEGKYAGWRGWVYSDMANSKWKTQNILVALGVIEPNEEINKTYEQIMKEAQPCRIRTMSETYEGEARAKIRAFMKASEATASDDEEDEEEDEDFQDAPAAKPTRAKRGKKVEPEPEPEDDEDDEGEDEDKEDDEEDGIDLDALEAELEDMSVAKLKAKAKELGVPAADIKEAGRDQEALIDVIMDFAEEKSPGF